MSQPFGKDPSWLVGETYLSRISRAHFLRIELERGIRQRETKEVNELFKRFNVRRSVSIRPFQPKPVNEYFQVPFIPKSNLWSNSQSSSYLGEPYFAPYKGMQYPFNAQGLDPKACKDLMDRYAIAAASWAPFEREEVLGTADVPQYRYQDTGYRTGTSGQFYKYTNFKLPTTYLRSRRWYENQKPWQEEEAFRITNAPIEIDRHKQDSTMRHFCRDGDVYPPRTQFGVCMAEANSSNVIRRMKFDIPNDTFRSFEFELSRLSHLRGVTLSDLDSPDPVNPDVVRVMNEASNAALSKINERDVSLLMTLAGLKQTISMLSKLLQRLTGALKALQQKNLGDILLNLGTGASKRDRYGKTFSDFWLEYNFGWKQLLADILGCIKFLKEFVTQHPPIQKASGRSSYSTSIEWEDTDFKFIGAININSSARYYYTAVDELIRNLEKLGLLNPLEAAWDAVPFSFVIDWIIPVNKFFLSFSEKVGVDFVGGYINQLTTVHGTLYWDLSGKDHTKDQSDPFEFGYDSEGNGPFGHGTRSIIRGSIDVRQELFQRLALPDFRERKFYLRNPIDLWKVTTSLALILKSFR